MCLPVDWTHLHGATAGTAVGPRQHRRSPLGGPATSEQVVEQRGRAGADEGVEGGDREHAQLVQRVLRGPRNVCQQRLLNK